MNILSGVLSRRILHFSFLAGTLASVDLAHAAVYSWANTGTDFTADASWIGGVAPTVTGTAVFDGPMGTNPSLSLSTTISSLQFTAVTSSSYVLSGTPGASLTLTRAGSVGTTSAINALNTSGSNVIGADLILGAASGSTQTITQASGGTLVLNGSIASTNSVNLAFATTGAVYLVNGANTYTGTTSQTAGNTLVLGHKAALGASTLSFQSTTGKIQASTDLIGANKIANNIIFAANATETIANGSAIEFGGGVNLGGAAHTITSSNSAATIFSGVISNDGGLGLTLAGTGTTTLQGANTYTGATTISSPGGVLITNLGVAGVSSNLGTSGTINFGSGFSAGALRYQGAGETTDKVVNLAGGLGGALIDTTGATGGLVLTSSFTASGTGNKNVTLTGNTTGNVISGAIVNPSAGATGLIKDGTGTWTLAGANTYSGSTQLLGGVLNLNFNAATAASNYIISASSVLALNTNTAGSATLNLAGKTDAASSQTFASGTTITTGGAYHINLSPSGTGSVAVSLGTITAGRQTGFTLDISLPTGASATTSTANLASGILPNAVTINGTDFATVNSGTIAAYTAYVANTGTTLSTANNQIVDMSSGDTVLSGTTQSQLSGLRFNSAAGRTVTLDPSRFLVVGGGQVQGAVLVTQNVGANLSKITGGLLGGISSRDLAIIQNNTAGDLQIDSVITSLNMNSLSLTKSGVGKLILTANNTFGGGANLLNEGTVVVAGDATTGNTQTLTTTLGSNVLTGVDTAGLFIGQRITGASTGTNQGLCITGISSGTVFMSGTATATGANSVTFGNSGGLGTQTGTGAVLIGAAATLQIGNGGTTGSLAAGQGITNSGTVVLNHSNAFTFSNTVSGSGVLVQAGTGTATLAGTHDYTGGTLVNAGTLLVDGSAANSAATINSGGTLGGVGTVRNIILNSGGALAPGDGIGTLSTNNGSLVWNGQASGAFGQMKFQLSNVDSSSDLINLGTGLLDKNSGSVFSFDFLGSGVAGQTYTLITFGSTDFSASDFSYANLAGGVSGTFVENGNSLQFVTSAVPEPSAIGLGLLGLGSLLWRLRRGSVRA